MPKSGNGTPWRVFLKEAEARLAQAGVANPANEARRIIERATGTSGAEYILELDSSATERGVGFFDMMLARREAGEPLQYVLGVWGFRTLELLVDQRVLIPRPETEEVVEVALAEFDRATEAMPFPIHSPVMVDLGTGSGAIALSVAAEREGVAVWATELCADAALVARANLAGLGRAATRVRILEGSWFEPLPESLRGEVTLVVANPPYVAPDDEVDPQVLAWEPHQALFAEDEGLADIATIVAEAPNWLAPQGVLVVEIAPQQGDAALELARQAGFESAETRRDMSGRIRMLVARLRAHAQVI